MIELKNILPGDIIEYETKIHVQRKAPTKTVKKGTVVQITDKIIVVQLKNYRETINVSELNARGTRITSHKRPPFGHERLTKYTNEVIAQATAAGVFQCVPAEVVLDLTATIREWSDR